MASPFLGEIKMFGGNFAPVGYAFCAGQTLDIAQNDALFTLIGTTYGGDGQNTFNLPDFRGRLPVHQGTGPGLTPRLLGQVSGQESVALTTTQIPFHNHIMTASAGLAESGSPNGNILAQSIASDCYTDNNAFPLPMNNTMVGQAGGSQPHPNMMPYLCISFIIALAGIFPTQN